MSTLLRHVYCFLSQGKLENEFLWAEVERVHEGRKLGAARMCGGHGAGVCVLREGGGEGGRGGDGHAKLCSVTGRSFSLRQLNCGKRGSGGGAAICFACRSLSPRRAECILIKDANTHYSIRHHWTKLFQNILASAKCNRSFLAGCCGSGKEKAHEFRVFLSSHNWYNS